MRGSKIRAWEFSERVKAARTSARLSQRELAARLGVNIHTASHWENDGVVPAAPRIRALASALGVTVESLVG